MLVIFSTSPEAVPLPTLKSVMESKPAIDSVLPEPEKEIDWSAIGL